MLAVCFFSCLVSTYTLRVGGFSPETCLNCAQPKITICVKEGEIVSAEATNQIKKCCLFQIKDSCAVLSAAMASFFGEVVTGSYRLEGVL